MMIHFCHDMMNMFPYVSCRPGPAFLFKMWNSCFMIALLVQNTPIENLSDCIATRIMSSFERLAFEMNLTIKAPHRHMLRWRSVVHLIHSTLSPVTRVNWDVDGLWSSPTTIVFLFHHDSIYWFDGASSHNAWTLCRVAGMPGVTVPGHRVFSWHVTWRCYAIILVRQPSF